MTNIFLQHTHRHHDLVQLLNVADITTLPALKEEDAGTDHIELLQSHKLVLPSILSALLVIVI